MIEISYSLKNHTELRRQEICLLLEHITTGGPRFKLSPSGKFTKVREVQSSEDAIQLAIYAECNHNKTETNCCPAFNVLKRSKNELFQYLCLVIGVGLTN